MSMYVVNDLHGNSALIEKTINAIGRMAGGDVLIVNGDGAGARGPRMNKIVKIFYEVRRGETDYEELISALAEIIGKKPDIPKSWVFDSVHAGLFRAVMAKHFEAFKECVEAEILEVLEETLRPLAEAAKEKGIKIFYVPGNGEIVPGDFSTEDISVEQTLPPEERFYQKIAKEGYFSGFGVEYVPYARNLFNGVALLSSNLLDLDSKEALGILKDNGLLDSELRTVVVHYPPAISPTGRVFNFWTPNKVDVSRIDALNKILDELQLQNAAIFFGHVHLPATDPRMDYYPPIIGFGYEKDYTGLWVKPGEVIEVRTKPV